MVACKGSSSAVFACHTTSGSAGYSGGKGKGKSRKFGVSKGKGRGTPNHTVASSVPSGSAVQVENDKSCTIDGKEIYIPSPFDATRESSLHCLTRFGSKPLPLSSPHRRCLTSKLFPARPECKCWCQCTRKPRRRIQCPVCWRSIGPGCCWRPAVGMCHECQKWQPDPWQPEPEQAAQLLNPPLSPTEPLSDYSRCYINPTSHNYPYITYIGGNLHNRDESDRVLSPPLTPTEPCDLPMDQHDWWYKATPLNSFPLKKRNGFPIYTPDCMGLRIACATATRIMLKDHHLDYNGPPPLITGPWMLSKPDLGKLISSLISLASAIMDAFDRTYKDYLTLDALWRMCKTDGDTIEEEFLCFWAGSSASHQKANRATFEWLALAQDNPHLDMCMPSGPAGLIMEVPPETAILVRHVCGWLRKINARSYFAGARVRVPVSIADKVDQPEP